MRIRVKIILALLIGTFCFTTYGVQAANVQASKEKMSAMVGLKRHGRN